MISTGQGQDDTDMKKRRRRTVTNRPGADINDERRASRRRHALRHLADGERPESVAAWMGMPMNEVYEIMGSMGFES